MVNELASIVIYINTRMSLFISRVKVVSHEEMNEPDPPGVCCACNLGRRYRV
jgi:hypothetical protein